MEIKKSKTTFITSVLKVVYYLGGPSFFDFQFFLPIKIKVRIKAPDQGSGSWFRTKVPDQVSGSRFRFKVSDQGSGSWFRIKVPDQGSGSSFWIKIPLQGFGLVQ